MLSPMATDLITAARQLAYLRATLRCGAPLPPARKLAGEWGVSVRTVRRRIRAAAEMNEGAR